MRKFWKAIVWAGTVGGVIYASVSYYRKKAEKEITRINGERGKFFQMFRVTDDWLNKKIKGMNIKDYLNKKNYNKIAIYGMSFVGQTLINELEGSEIEIKYGVDRDAEVYWDAFPIKKPEQITSDDTVDAVIVTALSFVDEVRAALQDKLDCPIISLEEIVDAM